MTFPCIISYYTRIIKYLSGTMNNFERLQQGAISKISITYWVHIRHLPIISSVCGVVFQNLFSILKCKSKGNYCNICNQNWPLHLEEGLFKLISLIPFSSHAFSLVTHYLHFEHTSIGDTVTDFIFIGVWKYDKSSMTDMTIPLLLGSTGKTKLNGL